MTSLSLTVLIAVYNKENPVYFHDALKSINEQTLMDFKIVLVEDGTLNLPLSEVVQQWKAHWKDRLTVVTLPTNQGLAHALNAGLQYVNTEWVARADSDDISKPHRLAQQMEYLKTSSIDVLGCAVEEFSTDSNKPARFKKIPCSHQSILKQLWKRNPINHPTTIFRKKAVLEAGGYVDLPLLEDYHLWVRMLAQGKKFANLPQALYCQRINRATYRRRGGMINFIHEMKVRLLMHRLRLVSYDKVIYSFFIQIPLRLLPCGLRQLFWKFSRKSM